MNRPTIRLVSVVGTAHAALLGHLVRHYRDLGVEAFCLILHAESVADPGYVGLRDLCRDLGIVPFHTHLGRWSDLRLSRRLTEFAMTHHPDDWFVVTDADEFQVYDRPLAELLRTAEALGADHVNGCFLDRVTADGSLTGITAEPLWRQYPLAGAVSAGICRALPLKACIARGGVELLLGNHATAVGTGVPRAESYVQVHHFKWTAAVVEQMRRRLSFLEPGDSPGQHDAVINEARSALAHIDRGNGRIDTGDPSLRLAPCGSRYEDYPFWTEVADDAQGWSWTVTY